MLHIQGGSIHPPDESDGILYPSTPRYKLKFYLKTVAEEEIQATSSEEIRSFTTELVDMYVNNAITIDEVKDRILMEVFSRVNINRAQATLSIWEKRK